MTEMMLVVTRAVRLRDGASMFTAEPDPAAMTTAVKWEAGATQFRVGDRVRVTVETFQAAPEPEYRSIVPPERGGDER